MKVEWLCYAHLSFQASRKLRISARSVLSRFRYPARLSRSVTISNKPLNEAEKDVVNYVDRRG